MQRFYMNLTPELNEEIERKARITKKTKAEIAREALQAGLTIITVPKSSSAVGLLEFAKLAEQIPTEGNIPKDAIKNMDYYTWGGDKRE